MSRIRNITLSLFTIFVLTNYGVNDANSNDPKKSDANYKAQPVPKNWQDAQSKRRQLIDNYIKSQKEEYDWFNKYAFSEDDGTPYIILKLLREVAPELWGGKSNFLDVVGLFRDTREPGYPIARGVGISAFNRADLLEKKIDYASFTCAACHMGRVRDEKGNFSYLDGGINSEFNVALFRVKAYQTLQKIYAGEKKTEQKITRVVTAFKDALQKAHNADEQFFYQAYKDDKVDLNAAYEKHQIKIFQENARQLVANFITKIEKDYEALSVLQKRNYKTIPKQFLAGFPGMVDATGVSTSAAYVRVEGFFTKWLAKAILPDHPGITDFMPVWEQDKRKVKWDETKTKFHNGGGQWNGNIPIPIYRNIAAQLSLGLKNTDIKVAASSVKLLAKLPAPIYPFEVDLTLAKKGEALFQENCVACHRAHNGKVYSNIGVNMDRAKVVSDTIRDVGKKQLKSVCNDQTVVKLYGGDVKPCAEFEGVSLADKEDLIMPLASEHQGYNATPLGGIWAQAPYLHSGSVPTMFHLLVPNQRPLQFFKSRLEYDQEKLGFAWKLPMNETENQSKGYFYDTTLTPTLSNKGHDQDIVEGDKLYKLNWSDDIAGAKALIEYLKTF